ncbi:hypothetical protein ACHQM5_020692 [Ranunculus cassubicifolius]
MENTPTNRSHHHIHHGGGGGGREDCWSEAATATLIDAWGDRYIQLSRGNLRQKDWKEVADAVNSRQDTVNKPRKTDVQCKNRIDTIKKKYKLERSKPGPSKWPFFTHLDELIGANLTPKLLSLPPPPVKKLNPNPKLIHNPNPNLLYSAGSSSKSRLNSSGSSESSRGRGEEEEEDDDGGVGDGLTSNGGGNRRKHQDFEDGGGRKKQGVDRDFEEGEAFRELAKAIMKFGEVYERIESSKQQQIVELERQRMEFTKDLEFQRMQMFMEAQLELEKTKRPKYASGAGEMFTFFISCCSHVIKYECLDNLIHISLHVYSLTVCDFVQNSTA